MTNQANLFNEELEKHPVSTVFAENCALALWLFSGALIIFQISFYAALIYIAAALIMILVLIRKLICTKCYNHGKRCHVG